MRSLGDTIGRIAARQATMSAMPGQGAMPVDRLSDLPRFGSNPGGLRARSFVLEGLAPGAPLVVVLHGCTQTAAGYDAGSGWSQLADDHGFALLFAEQDRANNPNLCFNWFVPGDIAASGGEAQSIRQMTETMMRLHGLDRRRVFVTGLSAGGAMTMVMLATAPDLFAGGAVIAGLPHGTARTMPEAFDRMRGLGLPDAAAGAVLVRGAGGTPGTAWPTLSVWHGDNDATVDVANAEAIIAGWAALHGLPAAPSGSGTVNGHQRREWRNARGEAVIEAITLAGMAHGTPIGEALGVAAPFMLDTGISSTRRIAAFWGIAPAVADSGAGRTGRAPVRAPAGPMANAASLVETTLRQAGLLR